MSKALFKCWDIIINDKIPHLVKFICWWIRDTNEQKLEFPEGQDFERREALVAV